MIKKSWVYFEKIVTTVRCQTFIGFNVSNVYINDIK